MSELPAYLGGTPIRPQGPPGWPLADAEVLEALERVYRDGTWGVYHGPNCGALEQALREYFQVEHGLLCGSGTYAVELGLRALQAGPGHEVILSAYDFPGNFLSVHAVGAMPVLVDVDPGNWNLAMGQLDAAATPTTKAIIATHLHGGLLPMRELCTWAAQRNISVLEDAAQGPGAIVQGRRAGTWGDAGVISFGGSKLLSAGRGGALLTNRADVWQRARTHAMRGNLVCPLSELQAAVVLPQLRKLDARHQRRAAAVESLRAALTGLPGLTPFANPPGLGQPGYYKLGFQYDERWIGLPRSTLVAAVRAEGIALADGFAAAHIGRSPRRYRAAGPLPEAERAHHGCVVLHHPVLLGPPADIEEVARAVRRVHQYRESLATLPPAAPQAAGSADTAFD